MKQRQLNTQKSLWCLCAWQLLSASPLLLQGAWDDGPGIASSLIKHSLPGPGNASVISLDVLHGFTDPTVTLPPGMPSTEAWKLSRTGADAVISHCWW
jgi:hypothetical protein